jgi:hypothetical protein
LFFFFVDTKVDIWSLGCVLLELILQSPIFSGESNEDQLACIAELLGPIPKDLFFVPSRPTSSSAVAASGSEEALLNISASNDLNNTMETTVTGPPVTPKSSSISPAAPNRKNSIKAGVNPPSTTNNNNKNSKTNNNQPSLQVQPPKKPNPSPGNYLIKQKSKKMGFKDSNRPLSTIKTLVLPYKSPSGKWRKYHSVHLETILKNYYEDPFNQLTGLTPRPPSSSSYSARKGLTTPSSSRRKKRNSSTHTDLERIQENAIFPKQQQQTAQTPQQERKEGEEGFFSPSHQDMEFELMMNFFKNCLQYVSSERSSIEELVCHLWLNSE